MLSQHPLRLLSSQAWLCLLHPLKQHSYSCAAAVEAPVKVGFIGLGQMGSRMARNLMHGGHDLLVYDSSSARLREFCKDTGAVSASSPSGMAAEAGVIFTMLPSSKHVRDVYCGSRGILSTEGGLQAALLVDSSTIDPLAAREVAAEVAKAQLRRAATPVPGCSVASPAMVDAPVSGGTTGATAATLSFMCGGERAAVAAAEPYLRAMGKRVHYCGGPGSGQAAKVCNNLALAGQMAATAEGLALGARLGLDPALLSAVMNASSARCWSCEQYNPAPGVMAGVPASRGYAGGFAAELMVKDVGLALHAARETGSPAPVAERALPLYQTVAERGEGLDFSAVYQVVYGGAAAAGPSQGDAGAAQDPAAPPGT